MVVVFCPRWVAILGQHQRGAWGSSGSSYCRDTWHMAGRTTKRELDRVHFFAQKVTSLSAEHHSFGHGRVVSGGARASFSGDDSLFFVDSGSTHPHHRGDLPVEY
eukprot:s1614_g15.t1